MEQKDKTAGSFSGFVLLEEKMWDKERFKKEFEAEWKLNPVYEEGDGKTGDTCDAVIMEIGSQRVVLGYMGMPVANGEAEENAAYNYTWREAVEVTKKHTAQLIVMILGEHKDVNADGELFIKVVSTLCKQENVIGVYTNGVVYQPKFYLAMEDCLKSGIYPIMGLVWFHMVREEEGFSIYTMGMESFGKDEIEIIKVTDNPGEVRDFLISIVNYCVLDGVTLHDGETIGLTENQICKLTRSQGVYVGGMTLKLDYHE